MSIAYLVSQYPAPSHTFIRREVAELRRNGLAVDTFSIRRPAPSEVTSDTDRRDEQETWYAFDGIGRLGRANAACLFERPRSYLTTLLRGARQRIPGTKSLLLAQAHFAEAAALASELERRRIRHLHNHFANPGANVGMLASQMLGIDWSFTVHGTADLDYPAGPLLPAKVRHAKWVACASHFVRAQVMRVVAPDEWDKLFVSRCGVNLDDLPERQAAASDQLRVLAVGRLSPEKGFDGLLEVFAKLASNGSPVTLRLIGDGPERARLERRSQELGLGARLELLGTLSERQVLEEMARTDVFVLSSLMEGLPVVLMEAMASGAAVVAPHVAGIPELVKHDASGLLFPPGDWDALGRALEELLHDASRRARFARAGAEIVRTEFDIRKAVQPLLRRFREAQPAHPSSTERIDITMARSPAPDIVTH